MEVMNGEEGKRAALPYFALLSGFFELRIDEEEEEKGWGRLAGTCIACAWTKKRQAG